MGAGPGRYAVIGRSEGEPVLYHADKTRDEAERLCERREAATSRPCYVISMAAWQANPREALRRAERERFGPDNS